MCRTEYLRSQGVDYPSIEKMGIFLVVRKAELEYHRSASYDEVVEVIIKRIEVHKIRVDFYYDIVDNESRKLLISAFIQLVCVDENGKPIKLPDQLNTFLINKV
jgi:YbgC/YbaW family acyl-CoA thioester hydrolase